MYFSVVGLNQSYIYPSSSSQDHDPSANSKLTGMYPLGTMNISANSYVMLQGDVEQKNVSSSREKRLIVSAVV